MGAGTSKKEGRIKVLTVCMSLKVNGAEVERQAPSRHPLVNVRDILHFNGGSRFIRLMVKQGGHSKLRLMREAPLLPSNHQFRSDARDSPPR